ncbi:fatty acid desaturase [Vibrio maerlii]|uniref:fatty acid desaturase n=1 Tax=Vibrio maerlii TaxID=2231648 RepID=UPI000E3DC25D|nr:fatty acid desaturase [Vibrio maerlii]
MHSKSEGNGKPPIIWLNVFVFVSTLLIALIAVPWYGFEHGYSSEHWVWLLITFSFCNLSITAGYHRLWSHKAFEANSVLRAIFALGGAFAMQNSALHWSSDHRIHHKHVDNNDKDPYSAKRGFWFSHIGWMIREYSMNPYENYKNCRDLQRDKILMWQHKYYLALMLAMNFGIPIALGLIYNDLLGMILIVGVLRLVLSHHTTFFINSLAHIWGKQTYTDKNTARDNGILAIFTFGEGYHNYHHIFEHDYRNGIQWWQYDPTKWFIKACSWLKLTSNLKVAPPAKVEQARAQMQLKLTKDKVSALPNGQYIASKLQDEFNTLSKQLNEYYALKKELLEKKRCKLQKQYELSLLKLQIEQMKVKLQQQRKEWSQLTAQYA